MRSILVVGNETLTSPELEAEFARQIASGPCRIHVLVPATPPRDHTFWTEGEARALARDRLEGSLLRATAMGAVATGEVGDASVVLAVDDALRRGPCDEIVLSTWPPGVSRWIRQDLPRRLARHTGLPVHHVVAAHATAGVH